MKDIFYFGASLKASLAQEFCNAGNTLIHLPNTQGLHELQGGAPTCGAVVLEWRSKRDQRIILQAKALGLPVLVITAKLIAAVKAGVPSADLYLEEPAADHEVVATMLDMMTAHPPRSASAVTVPVTVPKKRSRRAAAAKATSASASGSFSATQPLSE
jgi:hypothetical protein